MKLFPREMAADLSLRARPRKQRVGRVLACVVGLSAYGCGNPDAASETDEGLQGLARPRPARPQRPDVPPRSEPTLPVCSVSTVVDDLALSIRCTQDPSGRVDCTCNENGTETSCSYDSPMGVLFCSVYEGCCAEEFAGG